MNLMMVTPMPDKDGKVMKPIAIGIGSIKRIEDTSFVPEAIKVVPPKDAPVVSGKAVPLDTGANPAPVPPAPLPTVVQSTIVFMDGEVLKVMEDIHMLMSMS